MPRPVTHVPEHLCHLCDRYVPVAGVGERVKINDGFIAVGEPILNEIAADEARAAGDKYGHGCKGSRGGALK